MVTNAYAQAAGAASAGPAGLLGSMFPLLLIVAVFYFLVLAPNNKEKKKRDELLKSIQRGDRVLTRGGIWGNVADMKENQLTVKINENTKIEVEKSYIESVEKPS